MALVIEKPEPQFDLAQIKHGSLIYGKHRTWDKGEAGIVVSAQEKELIVQYYPGIANVTNHFVIYISEVMAGEWEIRWSDDLSEVSEFPEVEPNDTSQNTDGGSQSGSEYIDGVTEDNDETG
jgi:hypothetical protein